MSFHGITLIFFLRKMGKGEAGNKVREARKISEPAKRRLIGRASKDLECKRFANSYKFDGNHRDNAANFIRLQAPEISQDEKCPRNIHRSLGGATEMGAKKHQEG